MSNVEIQGVGLLGATVARSNILEPYFKENDKTPSWDGNIFVYSKSIKKENLKETIPVQIKSTEIKTFHSGKTSYSLSISDIRNYYNIKGTILFVVEIRGAEYKVFIKSLLPSELKTVLAKLEETNKKSKVFDLKELDTSTSRQLEYYCEHFLVHRNLQYSTIKSSLSITDAAQLEIPFMFADETHLLEDLFSQEHLLYGKQANETILRYIETIKLTSFGVSLNKSVAVNSKIYFSQYIERRVPDGLFLEFGNKIKINIHNDGTAKISYKFVEAKLSERITVLSFLIDAINTRTIHIGDGKLDINNIEQESFLSEIQSNLNYWKDVETLFHSFRIDPDLLNISILENRDVFMLTFLQDVFVRKISKDTTPFEPSFINTIKIGNITLAVLIYKKVNDINYTIIDLFGKIDDLKFQIKKDTDDGFAVSLYVMLKHDFLILADNLNLTNMLEDIKKVVFSTEYANAIILFGLELIKAFDISNRREFLDSALNIFTWLQQIQPNNLICQINKLQIVRRQRTYTKDEQAFLMEEKKRNNVENRILCAINILLENKSEAEINFENLEEKEKEEFIEYPIFALAKQLNILKEI